MIYESLKHNLFDFVRSVGYAREDQLREFFRDAKDFDAFEEVLTTTIAQGFFRLNQYSRVLRFHTAPALKPDELSERLKSLWVPIGFGSEGIRHITAMAYPTQISFITHDNQCYDVTVCNSHPVAQISLQHRTNEVPEGVVDLVNHIALTDSVAFGNTLQPYGFDCFCVLDEDHRPNYYSWEE